MNQTATQLIGDLAARGYTVRAIRRVCAKQGQKLPDSDAPIVRVMLNALQQNSTEVRGNEPVLGLG